MVKKMNIEEDDKTSESYISIGLGILVVIVIGILLYNYFTQKTSKPAITEEKVEDKITQEATMSAKPGTTYTVIVGDTLWNISEKSYKTGFNWGDIAKANSLTEPYILEPGQNLVIPEASPVLPVTGISDLEKTSVTSTPTVSQVITENNYTVVENDTLWDISCRAYGDCYAWTKIAEMNKLDNPDLIHPGNILTIPR